MAIEKIVLLTLAFKKLFFINSIVLHPFSSFECLFGCFAKFQENFSKAAENKFKNNF